MRTMPKKGLLLLLAISLLAAHFVWIASTWEGMGYTKDEGYYFNAAKDNFGWYKSVVLNTIEGHPLESFSDRSISRYWRNNHEHPPFCKVIQGLNHHIWHKWMPLMNYGNSHRMATWCFSALLLVLLFLLGTEMLGVPYGIFAVVLLFTLPRVFFHTHINTFDIPVIAMWFATAYAFRRGMESPRASWIAGLLLGVGLVTKNNAYFLPALFFLLYFYSNYRKDFFRGVLAIPSGLRHLGWLCWTIGLLLLAAPIAVGLMAFEWLALTILLDLLLINLIIAFHYLRPKPKIPPYLAPIFPAAFTAPLVFIALWPWIWDDTWGRLAKYFNRHLHPPAWETYYLHDIVVNPPPFPWHYPFVMSWYTVPALVIFIFLIGVFLLLRTGRMAGWLSRVPGFSYLLPAEASEEADTEQPSRWSWGNGKIVDGKWDAFFLLMNIAVPYLIIANPKTPIYGGTKHFMTAMPFVALTCALTLKWMVNEVSPMISLHGPKKWLLGLPLACMIIAPGLIGIAHTHPYTLSYYNELMGGSIAAPEVGMQRTFWAQSSTGVLEHLNKVLPRNGSVYFNNTPWTSYDAYKRDGLLRKDIRQSRNERSADYAVMNHWKYYTNGIYKVRRLYGADSAEAWSEIDGMPLTEVIRNVRKLDRGELVDPHPGKAIKSRKKPPRNRNKPHTR